MNGSGKIHNIRELKIKAFTSLINNRTSCTVIFKLQILVPVPDVGINFQAKILQKCSFLDQLWVVG